MLKGFVEKIRVSAVSALWFGVCAGLMALVDEASAIALLGGRSNIIYGPGYNSVNTSLFKSFTTFREQSLQFRADAFNLLNHPTLNNPNNNGNSSNGSSGGAIYGPNFFQNDTPDARFLQVSLKYAF